MKKKSPKKIPPKKAKNESIFYLQDIPLYTTLEQGYQTHPRQWIIEAKEWEWTWTQENLKSWLMKLKN